MDRNKLWSIAEPSVKMAHAETPTIYCQIVNIFYLPTVITNDMYEHAAGYSKTTAE